MKNLIDRFSSKDANISTVNPSIVKYSELLTKLQYKYQEKKDKAVLKELKEIKTVSFNGRNKIPSRIITGNRIRYVRYADE
jgi:hypothetical protein